MKADLMTPEQTRAWLELYALEDAPPGTTGGAGRAIAVLPPPPTGKSARISIPTSDGNVFSVLFAIVKWSGTCWLCRKYHMEANKSHMARWGCGWAEFGCVCEDVSTLTYEGAQKHEMLTRRFSTVISDRGSAYERLIKYGHGRLWWGELGAPSLVMNGVLSKQVKNFIELEGMLNEIEA